MRKIYEVLDEIIKELSAKELAEYIYNNNQEYAESLEFNLGIIEEEHEDDN